MPPAEAPTILLGEGKVEGIDGRGVWIVPPQHEASELSVEASCEEIHCVWTPATVGLSQEPRMELEIRRVLPPPTEQIGSSVLHPGAVDCTECDAVQLSHNS